MWLTGLSTVLGLLMVGGLFILLLINGLGIFWPSPLVQFTLQDGTHVLGEIWQEESFHEKPKTPLQKRFRVKIANRDFYGLDFRWIKEKDIRDRSKPKNATVLERRSWGNFIGYVTTLSVNGEVIAGDREHVLSLLPRYLKKAGQLYHQIESIKKQEIGDLNYEIEKRRLEIRKLNLKGIEAGAQKARIEQLQNEIEELQEAYHKQEKRLEQLQREGHSYQVQVQTIDGQRKELALMDVVRAYQPNAMSFLRKIGFYLSKLWEFLSAEPREANTEGGVFPAIFGTIMMVIIMSIAVVPLGVLAAIYMREYARPGAFLSAVRIAVNNLAGVPSIVFGIFGLGFFIYFVGGNIDRLFFAEALPTPTFGTGGILWASLTLALLTLPVVIVTTEEGLAAVPRTMREASTALGATKFETLWKVILPSATPSIFTGLILAIARAAGEVAPLMVTGVVKLAPSLPIDHHFPYLHLERKFMHLGFHIYDVGFQSPNVEAALPMVFATTLLLVFIVISLNLTAILLRNRLRKRFSISKL